MTIEFKNCSGGLIALDGVPVTPAPETKSGGLEDKAVWPQHTAKHPVIQQVLRLLSIRDRRPDVY